MFLKFYMIRSDLRATNPGGLLCTPGPGATPLGFLRVVHGPANDGDGNAMYAACAVRSLQGQWVVLCFYQERPVLVDIPRCAHS